MRRDTTTRLGLSVSAALGAAALLIIAASPSPASALTLGDDLKKDIPSGEVVASWYGKQHHGRPTASGEKFDRFRLTAAHPWLPFGTVLRVQNADTGRYVFVRVNDRGGFWPEREIDLSEAAARRIGIVARGEAEVLIDRPERDEIAEARQMMQDAADQAPGEARSGKGALARKITRLKGR